MRNRKSIFAHIVGNLMNVVVAGVLLAYFAGEESVPKAERVVTETKTDRLKEAYNFPDPATLSFMDRVIDTPVPDDVHELAKGIYFEARSENYEGQARVARVILRRVADPRWPDTIAGVIRQGEERRNRCQFSFMCDGEPEHITNKAAWKRALSVATDVYRKWQEGADMGCAHSYHATYVTSTNALRWFATLQKDTQVGAHIFYCDQNA